MLALWECHWQQKANPYRQLYPNETPEINKA